MSRCHWPEETFLIQAQYFTAAGDRSGGSAGELEPDGGGEEESLEGETQLADDNGIVMI